MTFVLDHIALSVKDVDLSVAFYQSVFRIEEVKNTASSSKTRWLALTDHKQIHLIPRPELEVKTNKAVHFALATPNFDAFVKHLKSLEVYYSDWRDTPKKDYVRDDGIQQIYFQDPDGYWIEVNNAV
ncbi:Catechol 2,3-dioxygenase [Olleya namhaensis]|uniref:Catechol 2,3-dioxygenase n=2 Tax=Olleya namhaensis TaxID=1144750 RepID=A0A1I3T6U3_9FLAO|nr:Catechol 2,3-dioxygenase [Olleya namhaensis]